MTTRTLSERKVTEKASQKEAYGARAPRGFMVATMYKCAGAETVTGVQMCMRRSIS